MAFNPKQLIKIVVGILKSASMLIPTAIIILESDAKHPELVRIGKVLEFVQQAIQYAIALMNANGADVPVPPVLASVVPAA